MLNEKIFRQIFSLALVTKLNHIQRRYSTHKRLDFTGISGVERVYEHIKSKDSAEAAKLLKKTPLLQQADKNTLRLLDIGGADGWMMLSLLQALQTSGICHLLEPSADEARIKKYLARAKANKEILTVVPDILRQKAEDENCQLPKADIILSSHSLYYNTPHWFLNRNLQSHLFSKFFSALNHGGVLCVLLQSTASSNVPGKNGILNNHEQWENYIYPLIDKVAHSHNQFYANAQMFELALDHYEKMYIAHIGKPVNWKILSSSAVTQVPLGTLNTEPSPDNSFMQSDKVKEILKFYLKGNEFSSLPVSDQKYLIDLLKEKFQTSDGEFVITHINSAYVITLSNEMLENIKSLHNEKLRP